MSVRASNSSPDPAVVDADARRSTLLSQAVVLAGWVGSGKALTAAGVLRRADVAPAAQALGLPDPGRVRSAADVEALHRPWLAAVGAGLLTCSAETATAADHPVNANAWLDAMSTVLRTESDDPDRVGAAIACAAILDELERGAADCIHELEDRVERGFDVMDHGRVEAVFRAFRRGLMPVPAAAELLAVAGALDGLDMTPLGRWAHPHLRELAATPYRPAPPLQAPDTTGQLVRITVRLDRFRPPVWRRVIVEPDTTLGELHPILRALFDWDDDHLHVFTVDGRHYADPFHGLDGCTDEDAVSVADALARPRATISYRYDLGDCIDHTITRHALLPDDGRARPHCVSGNGGDPIQYPDIDELEAELAGHPGAPFDLGAVNKRLAGL